MTEHEELLMHRAKVCTGMQADEISAFCKDNSIEVDGLTFFFLKYCRLPNMRECEFLSRFGFDAFKSIEALLPVPHISEMMKPLLEARFNTGKTIIVKKSSACGPTESKPYPGGFMIITGGNDQPKFRETKIPDVFLSDDLEAED